MTEACHQERGHMTRKILNRKESLVLKLKLGFGLESTPDLDSNGDKLDQNNDIVIELQTIEFFTNDGAKRRHKSLSVVRYILRLGKSELPTTRKIVNRKES